MYGPTVMPCASPVAPKINSRCEQIGRLFDRRRVVDVDDEVIDLGAADPVELHRIEADVRDLHHRRRRHRARRHPDHGAVARRHVEHVVGRDQRARARHVLDDDVRIAGDMSGHMSCKQPRPHVVVAAGGRADDDPDLLAFVEFVGRLRRGRRGAEHAADRQQDGCSPALMSRPPRVPNDRAALPSGPARRAGGPLSRPAAHSLINYCALHKIWADCMAKGQAGCPAARHAPRNLLIYLSK